MKIEEYLKGFKYPDKKILGSKVYADLPQHFQVLRASWEKIKDKLLAYMSDLSPEEREGFFGTINAHCVFECVEEFFVKTCWGWKPSGRTVKFNETDRFGQHCFGAMYTSDKHTWPMHKDIPYLPLAQIDLDKASALIDANVGDGMLQLFEAPMIDEIDVDDWYLLRHIPRNEISEELLADLPKYSDDQKSRINKQYIYPDFDGLFGDSSESIFIDDFNVRSFSSDQNLMNDTDNDLFGILEEEFPELYAKLVDDIEEYNLAIDKFCDKEDMSYDVDSYDGDAILFGYHDGIQMSPRDLDSPILDFGAFKNCISDWSEDGRTDIYGDGSGAIFVKFGEDGTAEYYFFGSR